MILAEALVDLFFPAACVACGTGYGEDGAEGLCAPCRGRLGRELAGRSAVSIASKFVRRVVVAGSYGGVLEEIIKAGKFAERFEPVDFLASFLADRLPAGCVYDGVVALPSDHAFAAALADAIAEQLGAARLDLLARHPGARRQGGLTRQQRRANANVMLTRRGEIAAQAVLLVDDVVTTGATLDAAAKLLQTAGVLVVDAAVIARTPGARSAPA